MDPNDESIHRIPVTINGDINNVVGWLLLSDKISAYEVLACDVGWCVQDKKLLEMTLSPKLHMPRKDSGVEELTERETTSSSKDAGSHRTV